MVDDTKSAESSELAPDAFAPQTGEEATYIPRCLVAMPFKEPWSNQVYAAIEDVMRSVRINVFRVDTTKRTAAKLADDVENQVSGADVVVADITGQNASVHVEIGLALGRGKEILLCTQKSSDVCAHLRDHLYIVYQPDHNGLEELSRQLRLRLQEGLERTHLAEEARRLRLQLAPTYSVECHRERTIANLGRAFSNARRRIDILTTNLSWLFKKDDPSKESEWDCIRKAIERNVSLQLRILTLNPQSEIAAQRARQLGFDPGNFRDQLQRAYEEVRTFVSGYPTSRVEVRLYNELPTQITFRIDDEVLYLHSWATDAEPPLPSSKIFR